MTQQHSLLDRGLIVVTGKGGVGKTTVASAIAVLGARSGRRTILCEVGGRAGARVLLGGDASASGEEPLGSGLWATTIDPDAALSEWAGQVVRPRALVELAVRSRVLSGFVGAAPGARELLTIAKAWELGLQHRWVGGRLPYELVVLDAPASGHGLGMLGTPRTFAEIARVGPIATQARLVAQGLSDPRHTAVVVVATAEETPVNETLELEARLGKQLGHGPAAIIVNRVVRDVLNGPERTRLYAGDELPAAVAVAVRTRHRRARLEAAQLRRMRRHAVAPVLTLPALHGGTLGPDGIGELSRALERAL